MYEDQTYEVILERMLRRVTSNVDKREGSIIWDALAPAAKELELCYQALDLVINETFPTTSSRDYLLEFADIFNIQPYDATPSTIEAEIIMKETGTDCEIGTIFTREKLYFEVIEKVGVNRYYLECLQIGTVGNVTFGMIVPVNYVGVKSAQIVGLVVPGENVEDTEAFRERLQDYFNDKPFGGNIADYVQKVNSIAGVGGTKVIRTPHNKVLYVDLYVIDSEFKKPSEGLIEIIQEEIQPILPEFTRTVLENSGDGLAPIGHIVDVIPVRERTIDIELDIGFQSGYYYERIEEKLIEQIDDYFRNTLGKSWQKSEKLVVRVSAIENLIYNLEGVLDVTNPLINGEHANIELEFDEIPVIGNITCNTMNV